MNVRLEIYLKHEKCDTKRCETLIFALRIIVGVGNPKQLGSTMTLGLSHPLANVLASVGRNLQVSLSLASELTVESKGQDFSAIENRNVPLISFVQTWLRVICF
jgi:hypothetical protein